MKYLSKNNIYKILVLLIINAVLIAMYNLTSTNPKLFRLLILTNDNMQPIYTLLTSAFIHGNLQHLIINLISFNIFGIITLLNTDKFWHLFLVIILSCIVSSSGWFYMFKDLNVLIGYLGFSGSVSGLMVYAILSEYKSCTLQLILFIYLCFFVLSNHVGIRFGNPHIAYDAHLFGAFAGFSYRVIENIVKDMYNKLNKYFLLRRNM